MGTQEFQMKREATHEDLRAACNQEKWYNEFRSNFTSLQET